MRLNELLNQPKNINKKQHDESQQQESKFIWATSNIVLMFLENSIKKFTRKPVFTDDNPVPLTYRPAEDTFKIKLHSYHHFKNLIYEIYDHRILHATEINGALNASYMTLDEHLLIFMLEKHKSRIATEKALIEFLSSLKYYCESWQRAKTYAQLLGFLQGDESFATLRKSVTSDKKLPQRLNDGKLNELDEPYVDIYVTEYFLHCYSLLTKDRRTFVESKEGYTYTIQ